MGYYSAGLRAEFEFKVTQVDDHRDLIDKNRNLVAIGRIGLS